MSNEYWYLGYHREYSEGYDEDGFAIGLPDDHPARRMKLLIDALDKSQQPVKIKKDYTNEFAAFLAVSPAKPEMPPVKVWVTDPAQTFNLGGVEFLFETYILPNRYRMNYILSFIEIRDDQRTFDTARHYMFRLAALSIRRKIQDMCQHSWQRASEALFQLKECRLCGKREYVGERPTLPWENG